jgi:hypothetical protein
MTWLVSLLIAALLGGAVGSGLHALHHLGDEARAPAVQSMTPASSTNAAADDSDNLHDAPC